MKKVLAGIVLGIVLTAAIVLPGYAKTFNENGIVSLILTVGKNADGSPYLFAAYNTAVDETPVRMVRQRSVLPLLSGGQKTQLLACYNTVLTAIQTDEAIQ